jgi:hypothetical protein
MSVDQVLGMLMLLQAVKKLPHILQSPKTHFPIHNSPLLVPLLRQVTLHNLTSYIFMLILKLSYFYSYEFQAVFVFISLCRLFA